MNGIGPVDLLGLRRTRRAYMLESGFAFAKERPADHFDRFRRGGPAEPSKPLNRQALNVA